MIRARAYAKVNLCLEVLGRRPDGYHEVATVLQTIDWADDLEVEEAEDLLFSCDDPALDNNENLAWRAARLLRERAGVSGGARISLHKDIPAGAGLGGGSSDAAETLKALDALWGLGLPFSELEGLAAELGSDVPFFLQGGTALAQGRGERITPLPAPPPLWVLLLVPPIQIPEKTRRLYSLLQPEHYSTGEAASGWVQALMQRRSPLPPLVNVFERVADEAFPGLEGYWRTLAEAGVQEVHLAGAGPALFSLLPTEEGAQGITRALGRQGLTVHVCSTPHPSRKGRS